MSLFCPPGTILPGASDKIRTCELKTTPIFQESLNSKGKKRIIKYYTTESLVTTDLMNEVVQSDIT
jgi:hypothetical protein